MKKIVKKQFLNKTHGSWQTIYSMVGGKKGGRKKPLSIVISILIYVLIAPKSKCTVISLCTQNKNMKLKNDNSSYLWPSLQAIQHFAQDLLMPQQKWREPHRRSAEDPLPSS